MAHLHKVRHYYVYDLVKPWSKLVMRTYAKCAITKFDIVMAHLCKVRHYCFGY